MASEVADLWIKLRLLSQGFVQGLQEATAEAETFEGRMESVQSGITKFGKIAAVAVAGAGYAVVKMGADWQQAMIKLTTSAGEAGSVLHGKLTGEIANVSDGLLKIAVATGTSTKAMADAMYYVESAGYHGAEGLNVARIAAEGAKAEGADTAVVANALTTYLHDMGIAASGASSGMNILIAAVARGKTTMNDTAAAVGVLLEAAQAVGIKGPEAMAAFATMTVAGFTAQRAAQDLSHTLLSLQNPTALTVKWMSQMGLSAQDLKSNLGTRGLLGTITEIDQAILTHMGKDGSILMTAFNNSKTAAADLNTMLAQMPTALRNLSTQVEQGTLTAKEYNKITNDMPANLKAQATEFLNLYKNASSFNLALRNGVSGTDTFAGMLRKVLGDQIDTNTALAIGGINLAYFAQSTDAISAAGRNAGKDIETWSTIQQGFNFRMAQAKEAVVTTAIRVGMDLLPKLTSLFDLVVGKGVPVLKDFAEHIKSALNNPELHSAEDFMLGLWRDLVGIFDEARKSVVNLWQAFQPLGKELAGVFLFALKAIAVIVKDIIGPAFQAFTAVLRDHSTIVTILADVVMAGLITKLLYTKTILAVDMFKAFALGITAAINGIRSFAAALGSGEIFTDLRIKAMYAADAVKGLGKAEEDTAAASTAAAGAQGFGAIVGKMAGAIPIIGAVAIGTMGLVSWIDHLGESSKDSTKMLNDMTNQLLDVAGGSQEATNRLVAMALIAAKLGGYGNDLIKPIDNALAQMVQSGNLTQANEALAKIDAQLVAGGQSADGFNKRLTAFNDAVGTYNTQQREAALVTSNTSTSMSDATGVLDGQTGALDGTTNATTALADATASLMQQQQDMTKGLEASRALDDFTRSIQDLTQSFKDNGTALDGNSKAALNNRDALRNSIQSIVDIYNAQSDADKATGAATDRMKAQIKQLINQSTQSDSTRKKIQAYIDTLGLIPKDPIVAKVDADISKAQTKIGILNNELLNLKYGTPDYTGSPPKSSGSGHLKLTNTYGSGGFVTGQKGQPQLAIVHGGEYVVSLEEQQGLGNGSSSGGAYAAGLRGGVTIIVNNQGSVIAERDLRDLVQTLYLQLGGRRSASYAPYKR